MKWQDIEKYLENYHTLEDLNSWAEQHNLSNNEAVNLKRHQILSSTLTGSGQDKVEVKQYALELRGKKTMKKIWQQK